MDINTRQTQNNTKIHDYMLRKCLLTDCLKYLNILIVLNEEGNLFHKTQPLYAKDFAPNHLTLGKISDIRYYIYTYKYEYMYIKLT